MRCPYCAEDIQEEAKKCRYCSEWLTSPAGVNHPLPIDIVAQGGPSAAMPTKLDKYNNRNAWMERVPPFVQSLGLIVLCSLAVFSPYLFIPLTIAWAYFVRPHWRPFYYTAVLWCWLLTMTLQEVLNRGGFGGGFSPQTLYNGFELSTAGAYAGTIYYVYEGVREARQPENKSVKKQFSVLNNYIGRLIVLGIAFFMLVKYIWPLLALKANLGL